MQLDIYRSAKFLLIDFQRYHGPDPCCFLIAQICGSTQYACEPDMSNRLIDVYGNHCDLTFIKRHFRKLISDACGGINKPRSSCWSRSSRERRLCYDSFWVNARAKCTEQFLLRPPARIASRGLFAPGLTPLVFAAVATER